jgi:hypothetical protein
MLHGQKHKKILFSIIYFIMPLWDNVEKFCRTGQTTYDNIVHARACRAGYLSLQKHTHNV